ncbi:hypothetical protein C8J56DRAFT_899372 [Mycena floridula]|nr:hypothetical protein C8J56DRAFT_899372 [Mycena floridula]
MSSPEIFSCRLAPATWDHPGCPTSYIDDDGKEVDYPTRPALRSYPVAQHALRSTSTLSGIQLPASKKKHNHTTTKAKTEVLGPFPLDPAVKVKRKNTDLEERLAKLNADICVLKHDTRRVSCKGCKKSIAMEGRGKSLGCDLTNWNKHKDRCHGCKQLLA